MDQQEQPEETDGFVTLGTAMKSVMSNLEVVDQEPSPITDESPCPSCNGYGWVRKDVPVSDPQFGKSVECRVCGIVKKRYLAQIFRDAQVPARFLDCTFATYPVSIATAGAVAACRKWAMDDDDEPWDEEIGERDHEWRKQGLFLYGPYGSGKTGLAISVLRSRQNALEDAALFVRVPDLLDEIRATYSQDAQHSEAKLLSALRKLDLVVLDDIGAERPTDWVKEKLYTIIGHRHDAMLDTVFTSNLTLEALAEQIGERTVHRIAEMCRVVEVNGPNLRQS